MMIRILLLTAFLLFIHSQDICAQNPVHLRDKHCWNWKDTMHCLDLTFLHDSYDTYRNKPKKRPLEEFTEELNAVLYHRNLAEKLDSIAIISGCNDATCLADFLYDFAKHAVEYTPDSYFSFDNYPQYAIEALLTGKGDCEDKAILIATLFKIFGYKTILLKNSFHVAVGLECTGCESYFLIGKVQYAYVESTCLGCIISQKTHYTNMISRFLRLPEGYVHNRINTSKGYLGKLSSEMK